MAGDGAAPSNARFRIVKPYLGYVPIYPAMLWSWVIGSDEVDPTSIDEVSVRTRLEGTAVRAAHLQPGDAPRGICPAHDLYSRC